MRRTFAVLMVVGLFAAAAPAAMTYTATYTGSHDVAGVTVDMYTVTLDAGTGRVMGSLILTAGTMAELGASNPFQVWYSYRQTAPPPAKNVDLKTPTADDIAGWGLSYEQTDTHLLPTGIASWAPVVVAPAEDNDASIVDPGYDPGGNKLGAGSLTVQTSVPVSLRTQTLELLQAGVIHTSEGVWVKSLSADDYGLVTELHIFLPPIPEPATLSLLGLGALALFRRRRT